MSTSVAAALMGKKILKFILEKTSKKIKKINGNEEVLRILEELKKDESFINEISSEISNNIDIKNENKINTNINLTPTEFLKQYDECKNELDEIKKQEQEYFVKYRYLHKLMDKREVSTIAYKEIFANSRRDAELIFKETKTNSESLLKVYLKSELPRFTKDCVINYWKNIAQEREPNLKLSNFVLKLTNPINSYLSYVVSFYKTNNIKSKSIKVSDGKKFLEYEINDSEAKVFKEILEEKNND